MFLLEHLDLILKLIKNQNVRELEMRKMKKVQHPRCQDFNLFRSKNKNDDIPAFEFVTVNAKKTYILSQSTNLILRRLRKRSFYKAIEIISEIENLTERNDILQILYSVATYSENNHSTNLLKLWIDNIYIKKIINTNQFIGIDSQDLQYTYNIIITLGFEYKAPPMKKEPLW